MRTYLDCYPCFLRQALEAARLGGADEVRQRRVIDKVLALMLELDITEPPPVIGRAVHRLIREELGRDPYRESRLRSTERAAELLDELRPRLERAADPLAAAVALAVGANVIDLAAPEGHRHWELRQRLLDALAWQPPREALESLRRAVDAAGSILFIADNAGEVVLDLPLLELLGRERTTLVVRGGPAINDAGRDDLVEAHEAYRVLDTGDDAPGLLPDAVGPELAAALENAGLIIAKGQGNYEGLSDSPLPRFHLLKAKCPVIARHVGCALGEFLLLDSTGTAS